MPLSKDEIERLAGVVRSGGIPDAFNRFLTMTPEQIGEAMTKIGPKGQQLRDMRLRRAAADDNQRRKIDAKAATDAAPAATKPDASAPAIHEDAVLEVIGEVQQEKTMKTKPKTESKTLKAFGKIPKRNAKTAKVAKAKATTNARTPVKDGARLDGLRPDSKQSIMLDLALRDEGATEQAICQKLGWKKCRVTLKRVCDKVGAKLRSEKNVKGETVWFATMAKAAS